ncbi:LysR family transcriptional regulator [Novosphingobium sp. AAP1]|uniref:LysR family transcriptional regulator n=1 Tax=Novosphingobium sp. AAP1 TaxID=1523413 RepID=UPI0006B9A06D|nr:LysR family transcriptional regulator [Novosphingobium sp. AAP1]KPF51937.1 LysR family transcriptional regulator [Novosphingobium sp. AAP1]
MSLLNCEILDLRSLVAVAECRNFVRAAHQLNLSQPALSRRVQKLEALVGEALFERSTRSVRLTPAGQQIMPLVRRLLDEIDTSLLGKMALGERQDGRIVLASIPSATVRFLPSLLEQFGRDYRNVRVRVLDLSATECAEAVRTGAAEFGLALPVSSDADLVFEPLYDDHYGLVCRKDDPLAAIDKPRWEDLVGLRLVTVHTGSGNRTTLDAGLAPLNLDLRWFYEVTRLTSALALVDAGLGASILPRLACEGPEARDLVWKPLQGATIFRTIGVLRRPAVALSPAAHRLLGLLCDAWRERGRNDTIPD